MYSPAVSCVSFPGASFQKIMKSFEITFENYSPFQKTWFLVLILFSFVIRYYISFLIITRCEIVIAVLIMYIIQNFEFPVKWYGTFWKTIIQLWLEILALLRCMISVSRKTRSFLSKNSFEYHGKLFEDQFFSGFYCRERYLSSDTIGWAIRKLRTIWKTRYTYRLHLKQFLHFLRNLSFRRTSFDTQQR